MNDTIHLWLPDQPPRKSNSRRIVWGINGPSIIKSQAALDWVESALSNIPAEAKLGWGSRDAPIAVTCYCYYETRRPDLSIELVLDVLQKAGVISDDRYVHEHHAYKCFSKERPGVRVTVKRL